MTSAIRVWGGRSEAYTSSVSLKRLSIEKPGRHNGVEGCGVSGSELKGLHFPNWGFANVAEKRLFFRLNVKWSASQTLFVVSQVCAFVCLLRIWGSGNAQRLSIFFVVTSSGCVLAWWTRFEVFSYFRSWKFVISNLVSWGSGGWMRCPDARLYLKW